MRGRMDSVGRAGRMAWRGHLPMILQCMVVLIFSSTGWAQQDVDLAAETPVAMESQEPVGSYIADVTGNDVFIRSGPGTNFYHCGKLYRGDRVQVIKVQQGWSCIVPPPGCFSWIAMQYVSINLGNPTMGIVTGHNVGVYAGSDYEEPMYSVSKQVMLKRGQNVKLLSEEKDEYYKIAPPEGAYLWVSSQFLRASESPMRAVPVASPAVETVAPTSPVAVQVRGESELLDEYYTLSKLVKEQLQKPLADQDYAEIKEKLSELVGNSAGGRAARYADFTLKQVERFELACTVAKEIKLQSKELKDTTSKISEARAARLAQIDNLGKFAVIGKLQSSSVYASAAGQAKRYRVLDESGKTVCYVAPTGAAVGKDLSQLIGHKVGLVGNIQPHLATGRAFIEFTEIVPLD
jgi:uncharacterized protein YgiM (DUF1202 family)